MRWPRELLLWHMVVLLGTSKRWSITFWAHCMFAKSSKKTWGAKHTKTRNLVFRHTFESHELESLKNIHIIRYRAYILASTSTKQFEQFSVWPKFFVGMNFSTKKIFSCMFVVFPKKIKKVARKGIVNLYKGTRSRFYFSERRLAMLERWFKRLEHVFRANVREEQLFLRSFSRLENGVFSQVDKTFTGPFM